MLFLGNSYTFTNSLDQVVADLYDDAGIALPEVTRLAEGGYTLPDHVVQIETPGSDWEAAFARPQDDVVMQDQSQIPGFPQDESYFVESDAAAVQLDTYATAAGARSWFLMTWGRRDGDETNPERYPDFLTMQGYLAEGYTTYVADASADGTPAWLIPAGLAWEQVYRDDPDPTDPSGAFYRLYIEDGSHPSVRGTYLTACVIFMAQTGRTVEVGTVEGVDDAEYLRDVAAAVVFEGGGTYPWTGGEDTGEPADTGDTAWMDTAEARDEAGCGCQSAPGAMGVLLLLPVLRRRQ